jgi:hypothetical protein
MAYATIAELKAYLADPASGAASSAGMVDSNGNTITIKRWSDAELQAQLDAADLYLAAMVPMVTIAAGNIMARSIVLSYAAANILDSDLPTVMDGESRSRAYAQRKQAESMIRDARKCPAMLGTVKAPVYYL